MYVIKETKSNYQTETFASKNYITNGNADDDEKGTLCKQ